MGPPPDPLGCQGALAGGGGREGAGAKRPLETGRMGWGVEGKGWRGGGGQRCSRTCCRTTTAAVATRMPCRVLGAASPVVPRACVHTCNAHICHWCVLGQVGAGGGGRASAV